MESAGEEIEEEGSEETEEQKVELMAHEACCVAWDWTQPLLPLPPQPVQPSSGQSIRERRPFSSSGWRVGDGREREREKAEKK